MKNMDRILLCKNKDDAYSISEKLYDIETQVPKEERTTKYKYGVYENLLSSQFGLHVPSDDWLELDEQYTQDAQFYTPLWINERFINGDSFFMIGNSPFGFTIGNFNPNHTRKILEGNYSPELINQVRKSGRNYTIEIHNSVQTIIDDINKNPEVNQAILDTLDPYQFEELIAELLNKQGFDTFLTSKSGDGGRDIIAAFYENGMQYLMMVECKRRKDGTVIGPTEARALLGQLYFEETQGTGFNCAMLVTSASDVGPSALNMKQKMENFSIKDRKDILDWISQYGDFWGNFWVPKRFEELF